MNFTTLPNRRRREFGEEPPKPVRGVLSGTFRDLREEFKVWKTTVAMEAKKSVIHEDDMLKWDDDLSLGAGVHSSSTV